MIVENNQTTPGVFPPEGCLDLNINRMISELEKREIYIEKNRTFIP